MAIINKLAAIADAIRGKTGSTELLTLDQMVDAINGIQTGGGGMTYEFMEIELIPTTAVIPE